MTSPIRRVTLGMYQGLYAIYWPDHPGFPLYLCGFLTAENRAAYLAWNPGWEVVG